MNKTLITLALILLVFSSCVENYTSKEYLKKVIKNLEKIETATFWLQGESWNPGDTAATFVINQYVESYRNQSDSTIGSSWAEFETENKTHLEFAYDGKMRTIIYDDEKGMIIDSFKVRQLPFRPLLPPFF